MNIDINALFGELYTEDEINIREKNLSNKYLFHYIFLLTTALFSPPLVWFYFVENTNFGLGTYLFTLLLALISMVCLLFVTIWYNDKYENKIKTQYGFVYSDYESLFNEISPYENLKQKMKEILEIRPRITQYEYDTLINLAELLRDQEKNKELLEKINENIG